MTHGSVAKKVRLARKRNPRTFCPRCFWRTNGNFTPCPRHGGPAVPKKILSYWRLNMAIRVKKFKKTCDVKIDQPKSLPAPGHRKGRQKSYMGISGRGSSGGDWVFLLVPNTLAAEDVGDGAYPRRGRAMGGRAWPWNGVTSRTSRQGIMNDGLTITERRMRNQAQPWSVGDLKRLEKLYRASIEKPLAENLKRLVEIGRPA